MRMKDPAHSGSFHMYDQSTPALNNPETNSRKIYRLGRSQRGILHENISPFRVSRPLRSRCSKIRFQWYILAHYRWNIINDCLPLKTASVLILREIYRLGTLRAGNMPENISQDYLVPVSTDHTYEMTQSEQGPANEGFSEVGLIKMRSLVRWNRCECEVQLMRMRSLVRWN